ncbi:hypothetical protein LCGC14_0359420 [marine sediment metagenome]|uniref:Uncharacterized protein n=1 Tax=marine sediment metagenome TaxID=412755 RepID=A0A0F9TRF6_9ZZZZ|nr:hypothetical protein [Candidatus Aminicenantes bacterium]
MQEKIYKRECVYCKRKFETINETKKYCNSRCKHNMSRVKRRRSRWYVGSRICLLCKKEFEPKRKDACICYRDSCRAKDTPKSRAKARAEANKIGWEKIIIEKGMNKCSNCGYNKYFGVIDFHHVDSKGSSDLISYIIKCIPTPKRVDELDKCVALCANCHREKHIEEGTVGNFNGIYYNGYKKKLSPSLNLKG